MARYPSLFPLSNVLVPAKRILSVHANRLRKVSTLPEKSSSSRLGVIHNGLGISKLFEFRLSKLAVWIMDRCDKGMSKGS